MSTVKTNAILDASGGNTATINSMTPTADSLQGFRNRIINGDMGIDQRNAGASITPTSAQYSVDRWQCFLTQASKYTIQQNAGSVTPPAGFTNYLGVTSTSAYSIISSDFFMFRQAIEGLNVADLGWGTANAKTVTVSFWVRSSLTGTFGGTLMNSAANRSYPFTYTISAANTWEYETITIAGDTSGTWLSNTNTGVYLQFGLGVGTDLSGTAGAWTGTSNIFSATGATSVVGTNGATFYITGVQLEVGSTATSFERIDYGRELLLCYRYFQKLNSPTAYGYPGNAYFSATSATNAYGTLVFIIPMRAAPTFSATGNLRLVDQTVGSPTISALTGDAGRTSTYSTELQATVSSGLTQYRIYWLHNNNDTTASVSLAAEL